MTDATRPLVLGYVRSHPFMTDAELAETKQQLVGFAEREGHTLGLVFIEQADSVAAFHSLMAEVQRQEATAVLVLSLPTPMKQHLEHYTGARVLIAHTPP
jgi:putative heme degradation protein